MLCDVEAAKGHSRLLELAENHGQTLGEDVAFADNADDHNIFDAAIALHDLVRDPMQRAADLVGVHHGCLEATLSDAHERRRSSKAMRICRPLRAWRK